MKVDMRTFDEEAPTREKSCIKKSKGLKWNTYKIKHEMTERVKRGSGKRSYCNAL